MTGVVIEMSYCSSDNTYFDGATNSVLIKFVRSALFSDRSHIMAAQSMPCVSCGNKYKKLLSNIFGSSLHTSFNLALVALFFPGCASCIEIAKSLKSIVLKTPYSCQQLIQHL